MSAEVCRYLGAHLCVQMCVIMFRCMQDCEVCADVHRYADVCTYVNVCGCMHECAAVCTGVWVCVDVCRCL